MCRHLSTVNAAAVKAVLLKPDAWSCAACASSDEGRVCLVCAACHCAACMPEHCRATGHVLALAMNAEAQDVFWCGRVFAFSNHDDF
jgi:hypothetical protein